MKETDGKMKKVKYTLTKIMAFIAYLGILLLPYFISIKILNYLEREHFWV